MYNVPYTLHPTPTPHPPSYTFNSHPRYTANLPGEQPCCIPSFFSYTNVYSVKNDSGQVISSSIFFSRVTLPPYSSILNPTPGFEARGFTCRVNNLVFIIFFTTPRERVMERDRGRERESERERARERKCERQGEKRGSEGETKEGGKRGREEKEGERGTK